MLHQPSILGVTGTQQLSLGSMAQTSAIPLCHSLQHQAHLFTSMTPTWWGHVTNFKSSQMTCWSSFWSSDPENAKWALQEWEGVSSCPAKMPPDSCDLTHTAPLQLGCPFALLMTQPDKCKTSASISCLTLFGFLLCHWSPMPLSSSRLSAGLSPLPGHLDHFQDSAVTSCLHSVLESPLFLKTHFW